MASIAAINSTTPALQTALTQKRLEAARQEADQAEAEVQSLNSQVDAASAVLRQKQSEVKSLSQQVSQRDPTYQSSLQASRNTVPSKTQQLIVGLYSNVKNSTMASSNLLNNFKTSAEQANQTSNPGRYLNISA
jgi:chromosome segregation ATPase